jgi:hypothetical protein
MVQRLANGIVGRHPLLLNGGDGGEKITVGSLDHNRNGQDVQEADVRVG